MSTLLAAAVDTAIALALALGLVALVARRAAALRHTILAAAVLASLAAPGLELVLPSWTALQWNEEPPALSSTTFGSAATSRGVAVISAAPQGTPAVDAVAALTAAWTLGVAMLSTTLLVGFVKLRQRMARSRPVDTGMWREVADEITHAAGMRRRVVILQSDDASLLVTCGIWRPAVVLPLGAESWTRDRVHIVLAHELAHIRRHDGALQLAGELLRIGHWFNPLVWLACRRLRQESEYACDDVVINDGVEPSDYASELLSVARQVSGRGRTWAAAPAIAHPSTLERRIAAMLNAQKNRQPLTRRMSVITACAAALVIVPLAAASVAPAPQPALPSLFMGIDTPLMAEISVVPTTAPAIVATATTASVTHPRRQARPAPAIASASTAAAATAPATSATPAAADVPDGQRGVFPLLPGTLDGTVVDASGARLPGVTVAVSSPDQTHERTVTSDAAGRFIFRDLPPGRYGVALTLPGFQTLKSVETVTSGQAAARTYTLSVGALSEMIRVTCGTGAAAQNFAPWGGPPRAQASTAGQRITRVMQALMPTLSAQEPPVRVGGNILAPRKLLDVRPPCPSSSTRGVLILEAVINTEGQVQSVTPLRNPFANEVLQSATDAIRQWKFTPTRLNGQPIPVTISVTVSYES